LHHSICCLPLRVVWLTKHKQSAESLFYNELLVCNWIDSDAEVPRKRKLSRRHSAPVVPSVADQTSEVSETADAVPSVISSVLMVEVENVVHDPYKTTEEMKVFLCICHSHCVVSSRWSHSVVLNAWLKD